LYIVIVTWRIRERIHGNKLKIRNSEKKKKLSFVGVIAYLFLKKERRQKRKSDSNVRDNIIQYAYGGIENNLRRI